MKDTAIKYTKADLFCGIDGGGTATKVVVCNLDGEMVSTFVSGTINHYGAGIVKARENYKLIAAQLVENFGTLPGNIFVGNSAFQNRVSKEVIRDITDGVFIGTNIHFHSDVYIALLGCTLGEPGAVLISGTGSMACGIDPNGIYHTAGGWGQVLGDEGSGYHMAQEAMKAALRAYDGMGLQTQLTQRLIRYFNLVEVADIIKRIYYPPAEKSVIAAFATEVEQAAQEGDPVAVQILEQEASWLFKLAITICQTSNSNSLGFYGSVLNPNSSILKELTSSLKEKGITLYPPKFSPEVGALIAAFTEAGIPINETIMKNFSAYKSRN